MDAVEAGGGGGGGACEGTVPGLDERPDQQEEREALQLVSAVTAHLRRRLGAMELKMESTHGEASAAADALRGQVARMERLEDKMAAVERRLRGATGLRGESDDVDKMAAAERRLRRTNDLHGESDDANKMAVVERYLRRHTSLHGESDDDDDDKIAAIQRCLRRATNLHYECDVDEKIAAVQRCLPTATDHHGSSDGDDDDKMAPVQRCLPTATDHHGSSDGDDDDKMAAAERRLRSATGLVGYSDDDDDSSRLSVVPSDVDEYPACPGCGTSSSSSALSMTSLASSFAPDDVLAPDASLLDSIVQIASLLPAENIPPAGTFSKHHRFGIRLDSTHLSSTAAVDAPMSKESRLDSTVEAVPDVPMKRTSATRSSFSCRLCGVSCDSSASSNSAIAFPNQKTSRVDSSIQTVTSVFEKRVHSARSSFSRLCGPILDFSSASFTAGIYSPSQDASGLGVTAQTAPLVTNEHSSPAPTLLPRRLCERLFDSLSIPATTDADLRHQEARSLDSTAQTQQVYDKHTGTSLTRRFGSQSSDSLGSTTAPPSTSFSNVPRLHPNAQLPLVSNKCLSSNCSISSDLCPPLPSSASVASSETPKASLANVATQISEKHMPPIDTSLSQGLYKVLRSAAAVAERYFLPSEEPISRLTASTHIRANTNERLPSTRKESPPDVPTTSPQACDDAPRSTACVCPEVVGCPKQACTQTEDVLWSCGGCSLQAPSSGLLTTSGYVASQEELRLSQSLSRRSSSVVCQCPSTAGERKSVSGCGYALDKVSRSTSCATFSNTNIASSSGFYDCEDNSQSSSISGYDEQSQCSSFHPYSERVTQHVVWMSSPYNPSLYYCVPLINSSFCSSSCNEDASDMSAVAPDSPWSVSSPQSCFPLCDVAHPVTNTSKFSSGLRAISYAPQPSTTPPSSVTNCCTAGVLKSVPEPTCTEPSTNTSDVPIFSERISSSSAVNVLISDNPQSVTETSDCLIPLSRPPSSPKPLAREGSPKEIRQSSCGVLKSESSWNLLSFCSAFRKTSCVLSAQVTPSFYANLDSSKHSSESKIPSTSTPTPPSSPCTSLAHIMPSSEKDSSSSAASVNIQDTTCCSPDDYLSISQPSSQSHSLHDTSLGSDSTSSNINNTPVTSYQPASTSLSDVVTVPKSSLQSSCSPDIITVRRTSSNSVSGNNPIDHVTSASDIRDVKYQVLSRPSSPDVPPAPPSTPLSHVTRKTIYRSTISIHSHVVTPCSSALKASQPPCDGCSPDKAADHSSPDVRQLSSKTVILPKNVIRPSIPHIHSHILRPFSGCVSIKEDSRPLSGYSLRKGISETTFVIDSPKSANRPCVSSRPSHRPNASFPRAGDAGGPPRGVRKLVSEATFVVNSPKVIARPTVSCDDSKVARRSVKFNPRVTLRAVSPGSPCRAFPKAASEALSAVSVADLPSCARRTLPARTTATATVSVPLRQATARPPPSRVKVLRPHSAEVKLGRRLLKAAQDGKAPAVQKLLDDGADVNFTFATKWTALHRAVKMGHEDVVCVLLAGGADLEAKTTYDFTALHIAAYYDLKGLCLARLIDAGCDLGSTNRSGKTPLHYASEVGNKMAVRALLVAGADTASLDDDGKTPFDVAKVGDVRGLLASAGKLGKAWLN